MFLTPATPQVGTGGSSGSNVRVYVRTRPLLSQELENEAENILSVLPSDKQVGFLCYFSVTFILLY